MAFRTYIAIMVAFSALRAVAPARFPELMPLSGWWRGDEQVEGLDRSGPEGADVQVVYLPALLPREAQLTADSPHNDIPVPYKFDAFGRNFEFQLVPNRRLVAKQFGVWSDRGYDEQLSSVDASCHFLHSGPHTVAAFSACKNHALHGLIVIDNSTYEVRPLPAGYARSDNGHSGIPHIIRRAPPPALPFDDVQLLGRRLHRKPRAKLTTLKLGPASYTIEIALFLDEAAYKIFYPFLNYNEKELRDMILAYINAVQALYRHASLGTQIQLSLVRLTLLRRQPPDLTSNGEREQLLGSFCDYQRSLNVENDDDPRHWDMAVLLSGLDFYSVEGGRRNAVTMGLAPVGGVCLPAHACVISEFGPSDNGRPFPSTGFTSVYILAHEIGHNLGMHHDGVGNSCARDGYIMSPSRGTKGEATWSACSARVVAELQWATCLLDGADDDLNTPNELNHEQFLGAPGSIWNAKKQCEILLRDIDADVSVSSSKSEMCIQLTCRSPHLTSFFYAGPALPGTPCGHHMWCQGGECVPAEDLPTFSTESSAGSQGDVTETGGWSVWSESTCQSGCTAQGRGFLERRRTCAVSLGCKGSAYDITICDDTKICGKKKRVSATEFASRKCAEFAAKLPELDPRGGGLQAPHEPTRMWMGCAIFCRRTLAGGFYAPRVELNGAGLDPYFPDGTWCHHDGTQDYYCMQHHCLPKNFTMFPEMHVWDLPNEDVGGPFNARALNTPEDDAIVKAIKAYMSLNGKGTPILRSAMPPTIPEESENNWEVIDYVEIPKPEKLSST